MAPRPRSSRVIVAVLATLTLLLGATPAIAGQERRGRFRPGAPGIGDAYYPLAATAGLTSRTTT